MELQVKAAANGSASTVSVNEAVFGVEFKEPLIHQVVTAHMSAARAGTKAQKNRSDVRGGGIKPWRQKGTGRARAGSSRSPIWRKGGVTFAARPRDFSQKVNKKMYRRAIASILSELLRLERLNVVDEIQMAAAKTRELVAKLTEMKLEGHILFVTAGIHENLELAARNLYRVDIVDAEHVDPVSLVSADHVVMTLAAVKQLEERLA